MKKIIALGYHSVGKMYPGLSTPIWLFERHMRFLKDRKYSFLQFRDLANIRSGRLSIPDKSVLVYFDDGYKDVYKNAYPIFKRFGIRSTIFIVTDFIYGLSAPKWVKDIKSDGNSIFLTWDEIRQMTDIFEIGTHTKSHRKLNKLSRGEILYELEESRYIIEKNIGCRPMSVSFPHSSLNVQIKQIINELKLEAAISFGRGYTYKSNLPFLKKIPAGPKDNIILFFLKLHIYPVIRFFGRMRSLFVK